MTKEEILNAIANDKTMPFIQPEQLAGIVDFVIKNYQPSLPSNLDDAANNYGRDIRLGHPRVMDETDKYIYNAFKAGAVWMAGQGETHEAEIIESVPYGGSKWKLCVKVWLSEKFKPKGDKVIVQIRKK